MISLLCTDLDDNLLGDMSAAQRFSNRWTSLPWEKRPALVYCTDRTIDEVYALIAEGTLPTPNAIIGESGATFEAINDPQTTQAFAGQFTENGDQSSIEAALSELPFLCDEPRPAQVPGKSTWYLECATEKQLDLVAQTLKDSGNSATVNYACHCLLEITPMSASKGNALAWFCERRETPLREVLVAGDHSSDQSAFLLPHVARLLTGNTATSLSLEAGQLAVYTSTGSDADGLVDGLAHYGVIKNAARTQLRAV